MNGARLPQGGKAEGFTESCLHQNWSYLAKIRMENKVISFPSLVCGLCRVGIFPEDRGKRERARKGAGWVGGNKNLVLACDGFAVVTAT